MKILSRPGGVLISVKVVPNSSRDMIVGPLGDLLKIKVAKPPEAGAANKAVESLLARTLGIAPSRVSVVGGHSQPQKQVLISGLDAPTIEAALAPFLTK